MPTTDIPGSTTPGGYSQTGETLAFTAADVANGNHIDSASEIFLAVRNVHASTSYTVTITSVGDGLTGRTGDVSAVSIAAGDQKIFKLQSDGWSDANDQYLVSGSNASIEFAWWEKTA